MRKTVGTIILEEILKTLLRCFLVKAGFLDKESAYSLLREKYGTKYSRSQFSKNFYELSRGGYLHTVNRGGQESVEFTTKARLKVVENNLELFCAKDSTIRFVSFDIPEQLTRQRDSFRRTIKRLGFRQIQKSLWVCDRDVSDLVDRASIEYKVEKYIVYIVALNTNINETIKLILNK